MTDYYIRITETIPEGEDPSLWFKLQSSDLGDELIVLNKNDYTTLKTRVDSAVDALSENEDFASIVRSVVDSDIGSINNAVNSQNLIERGNTGNLYTYTTIKNAFDEIDEDFDSVSESITALENTQSSNYSSNNSRLTSLEQIVDGLSWKKGSFQVTINGKIYTNRVFYNALFTCLFIENLPAHKGTGDWVNLINFDNGTNDTTLFPPRAIVIESNNVGELFRLSASGQLTFKHTKGVSGNTGPTVCMIYPRKTILAL